MEIENFKTASTEYEFEFGGTMRLSYSTHHRGEVYIAIVEAVEKRVIAAGVAMTKSEVEQLISDLNELKKLMDNESKESNGENTTL